MSSLARRLATPTMALARRTGTVASVARRAQRAAAYSSLAVAQRGPAQPLATSRFIAPPVASATSHARLMSSASSASPHTHGGYNFGRRASTPRNVGIVVVPQQSAYIIERFGRYSKTLEAGLHFLIPFVEQIAYVQNLKEEAIPVSNQMAITSDNVTINIDGVLYLKINDPVKASYGVSDIYYAMVQLAQTTMRSELGKLTLDKTFAGREHLNADIVASINLASEAWGVTCLRYEIKDISPPVGVKQAMDMQAEAERRKRVTVLDSEGAQQSEINIAQGSRQAAILHAEGEAQAMITKAQATAESLRLVAEQLRRPGGREAVSLQIASQYVDAFGNIAKVGNTVLLPANTGDVASMVTQALAVYGNVHTKQQANASVSSSDVSPSQPQQPQQQQQQPEDALWQAAERYVEQESKDESRR